ncbi:MAG: GIY-YIG nuclease family protein [Candidatus Brocadiae bacterium]|nr:GIY-YIG nuclease family protein [Candidatus Brocadiia bacterium]
MPTTFTVYILRCADGSLYIGRTPSLQARLARHAQGQGCQYTAHRLPVTLVWQEHHASWETAFAREAQLKRWSRAKKEALVRGDIPTLKQLSRRRARSAPDGDALRA